jgi:long-chain acyl-CoA synthetase
MTVTDRAEIDQVVEGATVARAFVDLVAREGGRTALRWQNGDGSWGEWTFAEYADKVARVTSALRDQGIGRGDRIVLMMRNIPEFHVVDMASLMCGATAISIYNSSSAEQIEYLASHCEARLAVLEDDGFLAKFTQVRDQLPALKAVAVLHPAEPQAGMPTWDTLLDHDPADLTEACRTGRPDDLATVIYTSGTTGPPKGVMLSNCNVMWTVECLRRTFGLSEYAGKRLVSYLPMAHIAERMTSHYQQAVLGYEVTCCPDPGQVAPFAREVRPNLMFGVPRVWEKINAGLMAGIGQDPEKAAKFDQAVEMARPLSLKVAWGTATPEEQATVDALDAAAFRPIREMLGLDQLDVAISGAAPIPSSLLGWYRAIGVPMSEIYGMSESSGPITWTPYKIKPGSVGPAVAGCEVALAPDGEVICRGGNVFLGYLDDPEKTAEALDADGWLHTGDIGEVDDDGYFRIVDRKKELIITAGGKNISPANLEAALKTIPLVGQACAIGDQRPFVSALVVLDPDAAKAWARQHDVTYDSLEDLARRPDVVTEIEDGVKEVMADFNNAERVKKVKVLGQEWLPDSELLTPTSKLKRRGVHTMFAEEIEQLYAR